VRCIYVTVSHVRTVSCRTVYAARKCCNRTARAAITFQVGTAAAQLSARDNEMTCSFSDIERERRGEKKNGYRYARWPVDLDSQSEMSVSCSAIPIVELDKVLYSPRYARTHNTHRNKIMAFAHFGPKDSWYNDNLILFFQFFIFRFNM